MIQILILTLLTVTSSCDHVRAEKKTIKFVNKDTLKNDSASSQVKIEPRIIYVIYGYYCGDCDSECTKMYKHYLIGNATTFWTDKTDSYFTESGLKFETEMSRESEKIGLELINNIPQSFLKTDSTRNIFGCPDCDDGCGLYFEFQLDEPESESIIYEMEYGLNGTSGDIKDFGERIKKTIEKLKNYR